MKIWRLCSRTARFKQSGDGVWDVPEFGAQVSMSGSGGVRGGGGGAGAGGQDGLGSLAILIGQQVEMNRKYLEMVEARGKLGEDDVSGKRKSRGGGFVPSAGAGDVQGEL